MSRTLHDADLRRELERMNARLEAHRLVITELLAQHVASNPQFKPTELLDFTRREVLKAVPPLSRDVGGPHHIQFAEEVEEEVERLLAAPHRPYWPNLP